MSLLRTSINYIAVGLLQVRPPRLVKVFNAGWCYRDASGLEGLYHLRNTIWTVVFVIAEWGLLQKYGGQGKALEWLT